ncbi:MAG TPA: OsmC family peroxiredoxin, partial [Candidatus Bathyarchaeia archaeon]|nr:OsmC family peroxiredoxin [Candidatus Bathyarchaeia archaeon]
TSLETTVKSGLKKNEEGRMRVGDLDVQIHLDVDPEDRLRASRCLRIFEEYCTVTPSVRSGIEVKVNIV